MGAPKKQKQENEDVLVSNLHLLMDAHCVSEAELSRRTQIPQPTLHKILSGKTSDPRISTLKALAECFELSLDALFSNDVLQDNVPQENLHSESIPVISWQDCIQGAAFLSKLTPNKWENWVVVEQEAGRQGSFGLTTKPSMEPRFPRGSLLIVSTRLTPSDGDLAIVQYPGTEEATLREIFIDGPQKLLIPLKEGLPPEPLDDTIKVIGSVIQSRFSF